MARKPTINYFNKDYDSLKEDLLNFVKVYYPENYKDFSEASIGMMLAELNAYVGSILSYNLNHKYNELYIDRATERSSVLQLARNLGYNPRGKSPSVTMINVDIVVPVSADEPDEDYLFTIDSGMIMQSDTGVLFTTTSDINFANHKNDHGVNNRSIIPNYSNNEIVNYTIRKQITAVAGEIKTTSMLVTSENAIPFMEWSLGEDVTEILNMVSNNNSQAPSGLDSWSNSVDNDIWYEVPYLAQESVYVDTSDSTSESRSGYWKYIDTRFTTQYDENGLCVLTFGAGYNNFDNYQEYLDSGLDALSMTSRLNNDSLGQIPSVGSYLHVRYRYGGGVATNVRSNSINSVVSKSVSNISLGADTITLNGVISSISVNNIIPAIGGADLEGIEEIKIKSKKNFSSQDRCVTVDDYIAKTLQMPAQYGAIYKAYAESNRDTQKTRLYILTLDENGHLKNSGNDLIKQNLASWLENFRIINDFVEIRDGLIYNLGIYFTVKKNPGVSSNQVLIDCVNVLKDAFILRKLDMNYKIFISELVDLLMDVYGVQNVVDISFVNKVNGDYSSNIMPLTNSYDLSDIAKYTQTREIPLTPTNNSISSTPTSMFEIKYPNSDIKGRVI